ncbi:M23 family metallopeptidase [Streptomyces sp. NPDC020965]|uniref:M23 family metallopeptidase n=1 Tax=Streptomyces sp. NPDC020965 TaxID=3365105 RepID=UPI0037A8310C
MNDQHAHAGYVGHDNTPTGSFDADPLFGVIPGDPGASPYEAGHSGQYDSSQWDTGSHQTTGGYDLYATPQQAEQFPPYETADRYDTAEQYGTADPYDTSAGQYDTTGQYAVPAEYDPSGQYDGTGQWDASAWNQSGPQSVTPAQYETAAATFSYDTTGQWATTTFDTGAYDATAWNTGAMETVVPEQFGHEQDFSAGRDFSAERDFPAERGFTGEPEFAPEQDFGQREAGQPEFTPEREYTAEFGDEFSDELNQRLARDAGPDSPDYSETPEYRRTDDPTPEDLDHRAGFHAEPGTGQGIDGESDTGAHPALEPEAELDPIVGVAPVTPRPVRRAGTNGGRGRRRTPAKRSALLTVAVPSACVMGVAGIAAASVGGLANSGETKKDTSTQLAAADTPSAKSVAANSKMDTQLAALSAEARDFGDRASRTQERIDLKVRQEADRKKREDEVKRREALRPKYALPVKQKGLSTYYGQSGINWMALHTGIDFPVPYGAEVYAATDGTVRTQWNGAYGNMIILTAPDGTETWYCHLSSAKIRSGAVKAGDVIGYAGNSGNSTGPHLHFEVRPGGGSTINPLNWLRGHGLDPT